jgi:hypothetical protein
MNRELVQAMEERIPAFRERVQVQRRHACSFGFDIFRVQAKHGGSVVVQGRKQSVDML